jgi:hypothetical protein
MSDELKLFSSASSWVPYVAQPEDSSGSECTDRFNGSCGSVFSSVRVPRVAILGIGRLELIGGRMSSKEPTNRVKR